MTPGIAHVLTADDTLLAVVVDSRGPAGTARRCAEVMAASGELARVLSGLLTAARRTEIDGVEGWLAAAEALLASLEETTP